MFKKKIFKKDILWRKNYLIEMFNKRFLIKIFDEENIFKIQIFYKEKYI